MITYYSMEDRYQIGIRPSQRKKGYAFQMLSLALPIAKELGINKALITCDKTNLGSAKNYY